MSKAPRTLMGPVVKEWEEFGHSFIIEELLTPRMVGAGERFYRLWDNGDPATGGQWHYTAENAEWEARYRTRCDYVSRIVYLETRVRVLERQLYQEKSA